MLFRSLLDEKSITGGRAISDAFLVEEGFRSSEEREIVFACGARGKEVQEAFSTPEARRNERQQDIVRVIELNGEVTATAWKQHRAGQVICVSPTTALVCARSVLTCEYPEGAQPARGQDCGEGQSVGRSNSRGVAEGLLGPGILWHPTPASVVARHSNLCATDHRIGVCAARVDLRISRRSSTRSKPGLWRRAKRRAKRQAKLPSGRGVLYGMARYKRTRTWN